MTRWLRAHRLGIAVYGGGALLVFGLTLLWQALGWYP